MAPGEGQVLLFPEEKGTERVSVGVMGQEVAPPWLSSQVTPGKGVSPLSCVSITHLGTKWGL